MIQRVLWYMPHKLTVLINHDINHGLGHDVNFILFVLASVGILCVPVSQCCRKGSVDFYKNNVKSYISFFWEEFILWKNIVKTIHHTRTFRKMPKWLTITNAYLLLRSACMELPWHVVFVYAWIDVSYTLMFSRFLYQIYPTHDAFTH